MGESGLFLVSLGLPCCGKSTVMSELGKLIGIDVFLEPEEPEWGQAVMERDICGHFTGLMWFRSVRVPMLYQAQQLVKSGKSVITDTYYDKVLHHYIGKPGMEWLIDPKDKFFEVAKQIAELDWLSLPLPTCVITFEIDYDIWLTLLKKRNRQLDKNEAFLKSFHTQNYFIDAGIRLAEQFGVEHIHFHPKLSSAKEQAVELLKILKTKNVVKDKIFSKTS
ncbi:MAG: hypothetical protein WDZ91_07850 [Paenibacillaceae bacterium]